MLRTAKLLFLPFVFQSSFILAMEEEIDDDWVFIQHLNNDTSEYKQSDSTIIDHIPESDRTLIHNLTLEKEQLRNKIKLLKENNMDFKESLLQWAVKQGHPKVIKMVFKHEDSSEKEVCTETLKDAREELLQHKGECALEEAIKKGNLNFVKWVIPSTLQDPAFKAMAFKIAALNHNKKIARYLAEDNSIFNKDTLYILYDILSETIKVKDRSLESIKIIFTSNIKLTAKEWQALIEHGIKQSKELGFTEGVNYLSSITKSLQNN